MVQTHAHTLTHLYWPIQRVCSIGSGQSRVAKLASADYGFVLLESKLSARQSGLSNIPGVRQSCHIRNYTLLVRPCSLPGGQSPQGWCTGTVAFAALRRRNRNKRSFLLEPFRKEIAMVHVLAIAWD